MYNTSVMLKFISEMMGCDVDDISESDMREFSREMTDIKYFLIKDAFIKELNRRGYNTSNEKGVQAVIKRYI